MSTPEVPAKDEESRPDLANMRLVYSKAGLSEDDMAPDWVTQFEKWLKEAINSGITEPNAMVLATADAEGVPASRAVLAKGYDSAGIVFYTNYTSAKSADLRSNPVASVTFPWIDLQRQVHIRGRVEKVDAETIAQYWATRGRGSQLGAWASPQSTVLPSRQALDDMQTALEIQFGGGSGALDAPPIPVPPHWGGWRIVPTSVEFWQGRISRMHDRIRYRQSGIDLWVVERLAP